MFRSASRRATRSLLVAGSVATVLLITLWALALSTPLWTWWYRATPSQPTVLFIVLDTVRSDHLSLCGYPRPTSPTLERLSSTTTAWTCEAYAPGSWTLPSHASFDDPPWSPPSSWSRPSETSRRPRKLNCGRFWTISWPSSTSSACSGRHWVVPVSRLWAADAGPLLRATGRVSLSESVFPAVPLAIDPVCVGSDHGSFAARIRRSRPVRVSLPVANFRPGN